MRITRIGSAVIAAVIAAGGTGAVMEVTRPAPGRPAPTARPAPVPTVTRTITRTRLVTIPASAPASASGAAPSAVPHVNGATHSVVVNCAREQCTSFPGAGPNESTCGPVVGGRQVCVW